MRYGTQNIDIKPTKKYKFDCGMPLHQSERCSKCGEKKEIATWNMTKFKHKCGL